MFRRHALLLIPAILLLAASVASAGDINWISKDELKALIGDPNTHIIDARLGRDWDVSDSKIKGAVRENPMYVEEWTYKYAKDDHLVFY